MYADKFHSKHPSQFNTFEWYKKYVARFGDHKVKLFEQMAIDFGNPNVKKLAELYKQNYR